jgi:hypothetical protein
MNARAAFELLLAGSGAIGSRVAAALDDLEVALTLLDRETVALENLGIAAFGEGDVGASKAKVLAARRRARGRVARALEGDLRYTFRPGLARAVDAAILCLDNATAILDAALVLWEAPSGLVVLVVTCGGAKPAYQVRLCVTGSTCPVCVFGAAEWEADRRAARVSCADTTAPRAAAAAAEAAAQAGLALLASWRAGDWTHANCRIQCDPGGAEYVIAMPAPRPRCPIPHAPSPRPIADLGGTIASVTVGALAERAIACVGDDAELLLGRRAVPLAGLYCPRCRAVAPATPFLLPAALAAARPCACGEPLRALGQRHTIGAQELAHLGVASLSLAAWGAGHGDEFLVAGRRGRARLRCHFDWSELE